MEDGGWTQEVSDLTKRDSSSIAALAPDAISGFEEPTSSEIRLDIETEALLAEAMKLTNSATAQDVVRVALRELVERQRFLNWVADHEKDQAGTA